MRSLEARFEGFLRRVQFTAEIQNQAQLGIDNCDLVPIDWHIVPLVCPNSSDNVLVEPDSLLQAGVDCGLCSNRTITNIRYMMFGNVIFVNALCFKERM